MATWYSKRLKDMVVAPVDQRDLDIGSPERPCGRDAGKTATDDQDAFFALGPPPWLRRLFLRERFGQNCSHGCTDILQGQPPDQHQIQRGFRLVLNGGAVHRTSMPFFMLARAGTRSNSMRGRISPKVMPMMIRNAVRRS